MFIYIDVNVIVSLEETQVRNFSPSAQSHTVQLAGSELCSSQASSVRRRYINFSVDPVDIVSPFPKVFLALVQVSSTPHSLFPGVDWIYFKFFNS